MSDAEIHVEIEGEKPANDPISSLKGQLTKFQNKASSAESRAVAAEAEVARTRVRVSDLETRVIERDVETVKSGINAAKAEADAAQSALEAAFDAGDGKAVAAAQRRLAKAEAQVVQLESAESELKTAKVTDQPKQPTDPVERVAANMSPKSAAWVRAHPECITDAAKNKLMMKAHHQALADDISPDSDEYFELIESTVNGGGKRKAAEADEVIKVDEAAPDYTTQRRPVAPVAPGATHGGTGGGSRTTVKLTAGEALAATDGTHVWNYDDPKGGYKKGDPIGTTEFARRKIAMQKQGAYDRTYSDQ